MISLFLPTTYPKMQTFKNAPDLDKDLGTLNNWATQWNMGFNPAKSEMMIISNKKLKSKQNIVLKNSIVKQVTHHAGSHFSEDMTIAILCSLAHPFPTWPASSLFRIPLHALWPKSLASIISRLFCLSCTDFPVCHRMNFKIATITHRVLQFQQPSYLAVLIPRYAPVRSLRSSSSLSICAPYTQNLPGNLQIIFICRTKTLEFTAKPSFVHSNSSCF